jgi:hypothetical protein
MTGLKPRLASARHGCQAVRSENRLSRSPAKPLLRVEVIGVPDLDSVVSFLKQGLGWLAIITRHAWPLPAGSCTGTVQSQPR